jgi:hypothetical protein
MIVQVKYKTPRGGWKWLTCTCCKQIRTFTSFQGARNAAVNQLGNDVRTRCYRINSYGVPYFDTEIGK